MKQGKYNLDSYQFKCCFDDDPDILEFVVKYEGLPVIGSGKNIEEAVKEARENLKIYFVFLEETGKSIPAPNVDTDSLYINYSGHITVRLPKSLHRRLALAAEKESVSINSLIMTSVEHYITQRDYILEPHDIISKTKDSKHQDMFIFKEIYKSWRNNDLCKRNQSV